MKFRFIYPNLSEFIRIYPNLSEFIRIYPDFSGFLRICSGLIINNKKMNEDKPLLLLTSHEDVRTPESTS